MSFNNGSLLGKTNPDSTRFYRSPICATNQYVNSQDASCRPCGQSAPAAPFLHQEQCRTCDWFLSTHNVAPSYLSLVQNRICTPEEEQEVIDPKPDDETTPDDIVDPIIPPIVDPVDPVKPPGPDITDDDQTTDDPVVVPDNDPVIKPDEEDDQDYAHE